MGNLCCYQKVDGGYTQDDNPTFSTLYQHSFSSFLAEYKNKNTPIEKSLKKIEDYLYLSQIALCDFINKAYNFGKNDPTYDGIPQIDITYNKFKEENNKLNKENFIEFFNYIYSELSENLQLDYELVFGIIFDTLIDYLEGNNTKTNEKFLNKSALVPLGFCLCYTSNEEDQFKSLESYIKYDDKEGSEEFFTIMFTFFSVVLINIKEKNKKFFGELSKEETEIRNKYTPQFINNTVNSMIESLKEKGERDYPKFIFEFIKEKKAWPFSGKGIRIQLSQR